MQGGENRAALRQGHRSRPRQRGKRLVHREGLAQDPEMIEKTPHSGPGDPAKLGELIRDIRIALLTTIDRDGRFHTRPVQTLQVEADRTLWFFTDWNAPKVDELHHDVRVSLGYAQPEKSVYVAVSGSASLLRDAQKAKKLWSVEQRAYYPEGPGDERLALLRVVIERAEYWIAPGRTSYVVAAMTAAISGTPAGESTARARNRNQPSVAAPPRTSGTDPNALSRQSAGQSPAAADNNTSAAASRRISVPRAMSFSMLPPIATARSSTSSALMRSTDGRCGTGKRWLWQSRLRLKIRASKHLRSPSKRRCMAGS